MCQPLILRIYLNRMVYTPEELINLLFLFSLSHRGSDENIKQVDSRQLRAMNQRLMMNLRD